MSSVPPNHEYLSLKLTEVLSDVGLNGDMVMKRREGALFKECVPDVTKVLGTSESTWHFFGSQSEGSTTIGINSDTDILCNMNTHHVVRDWADWKLGETNVLMLQDETTASGYCLLQLLSDEAPLATYRCPNMFYYKDAEGKVLLKNTIVGIAIDRLGLGYERHGPAAMPQVRDGFKETDLVWALQCERWPTEGRRWLHRRNRGGWPSAQLKSESEKSGCFLVPVGSKVSGLDELEWRISTSVAERYLMFSLNITQLNCYVLMKMLLKSHYVFQNVISSYMCKTALFYCIENTYSDFWHERNLLLCLNETLQVLYDFIFHCNCPHFIIPENNLMAGRISEEQQHNLLECIQQMINSDGRMLFEIRIDHLGERLQMNMSGLVAYPRDVAPGEYIRKRISGELCYHSAHTVGRKYTICALAQKHVNVDVYITLRQFICYYEYIRCEQQRPHFNNLEQIAYSCVSPLLCSTIGSLLACYYVSINRPLSDIVLPWFQLGLDSDVSSCWLKLATVCNTLNDVHTETILRRIDQHYDRNVVMPVCCCNDDSGVIPKQGFENVADQIQVTDYRQIVSYCVIFMRSEINIVPQEMRQEFFRSTEEDLQCRNIVYDKWMGLAVVDSLPYLYFLQYKTYGRLRKRGEQLRALHKLYQVIHNEPNLRHKETALNLLGQCMEQENLPNDAFICYERSLQVRPRNNAANFHMTRLLAG